MNDFKTESKRLMKNSNIYLDCAFESYLEVFNDHYESRLKDGVELDDVLGNAQDMALLTFIKYLDKIRDEAMSQYMFYTELKPLLNDKK